ncbi:MULTISPECIES: general secretion pathway protein GspN [Dyella]|uniref:General secretion pathway protein GspN n=2 Tax=Dyella TaxID=231454 RepID=A0A4R0YT58_9GAMM|nr:MULTISPECIES: general secretion pathway protein GspN [Dyella]TBR36642.1 general secretion pathway protein GspN [Dyella terrae]TCI08267.1 general secretion pathway protein GspN [Dyella soli]
MNAAGQRRLTPVLAGTVIGLAVVCLVLMAGVGRGVHWDSPRTPAELPDARAGNLPVPVPLAQFAAVWQQPLFNPDRKPVTRAAKGGANLGDMQLTGIIMTPGLRMALLHAKGGDSDIRVREGETLPDGSWKLVELKPRAAVFESGSGRTELELPAGAPIDAPKQVAATQASASVPALGLPAGAMQRVAPGTGNHMTFQAGGDGTARATSAAPSPDSNAPRPPQSDESLQADRIRQLKAAIQKRRAEQAAGTPEGAH